MQPPARVAIQSQAPQSGLWAKCKSTVAEFIFPSSQKERGFRHRQFRDVGFFLAVTGAMVTYEKTIEELLIKPATK